MNRTESAQIEVLRVLCIVSMMWVHVSPGISFPSYVNGGPLDWMSNFFGETLGRVSVTTLSFVSGYLFWSTGFNRPFSSVLRRLWFAILAPMLFWSALFIILAVGKEVIVGSPATAIRNIGNGRLAWMNAWVGLTGPTANESLFFIRDLVVATMLIRLAAPVQKRWPWLVFGLALGAALFRHTQPVLFRPNILLFMVLGSLAAQNALTISKISAPGKAVAIGLALTLVTVVMARGGFVHSTPIGTVFDLIRRAGIGFLVLALSAAVVRIWPTNPIISFGRHSFLAYLSHSTIFGVMWVGWTHVVGRENQASYVAFYLLAPPLVFAMAVYAGNRLDRAAAPVQLCVRGKATAVGAPRTSTGSVD